MNNRKQNIPKRIIWLPDILLILAGILLDQFTKHLAVVYLKGSQPVSLIPGVLENRGAAFGMMQGAKVFFLIITPVILVAVIYALIKMPSDGKYRVLHILLDCVAVGAVGNMIDRIRLDYVVDFIYISLIDFPIFNVADMFVSIACVVGAILILFSNKYKDEDFRFLSFKQKQSIPKEEDSPENEKE
mgnify:CR=1 FL=1